MITFKPSGWKRYELSEDGEDVGLVYKTTLGWNARYRGTRAGGGTRKRAVEAARADYGDRIDAIEWRLQRQA